MSFHPLLRRIQRVLLLVCQFFVLGQCGIGCLDNNGKPVDWFIVIKLPRLPDSSEASVQQGVGQLYMDDNNRQWTLLDFGINSTSKHAVYNTLQQMYKQQKSQNVMYMLYNDEVPGGRASLNHGHTKGDICFDKSSGFWLVHSVPKFPPKISQGYGYPESGTIFGQSLLCVTYGYQQLDKIGQQFLYNYPKIYDYNLPSSFASANPKLAGVAKGKHVSAKPWSNILTLTSKGGQSFVSFAKFVNYGADLYDSLVAPYFKSGLDVETWLNGRGPMPSNCSADYKVANVKELNYLDNSYDVHHDHSKWAVSLDDKWICIGDINREFTQNARAGGTVCSQLQGVPDVFSKGIVSTEPCESKKGNVVFNSWQFHH